MGYYQRIRDLLEDNDMTQDNICNILKMHKSKYKRYENGECKIDFDFIVQLAKLYNTSIDYIAGLINKKHSYKDWE